MAPGPLNRRPFKSPSALAPAVLALVVAAVLSVAAPSGLQAASQQGKQNHLAGSSSPYLLMHADNPIDWYPWGAEALERARREDKPIFLSIGYSACHWCHVMEQESFSDQEIAGLLNEGFVAIKVDREERPDLDSLYINAVIAATGGGGWPMSVFLTPDLRPFHAGTYYPHDRFRDLVGTIGNMWKEQRARLIAGADALRQAMAELQKTPSDGHPDDPSTDLIGTAVIALKRTYDAPNGGFGKAPKFPPHGALALLLRAHREAGDDEALRMAAGTLEAMARGGVNDQIGGGFHRYAIDAAWRVPHFEKMLSDNALLVPLYLMAWKQTNRPEFRAVADSILTWAQREMSDAQGGYYTSLDADTGGVEGAYYTWTPEELQAALPAADAPLVAEYYGVTPKGDLRGRSVLAPVSGDKEFAAKHSMTPETWRGRLDGARRLLLQARQRRSRPACDDKVLTAWNGLMVSALAAAHVATGEKAYLDRARQTAGFALRSLRDTDGRPRVSWRRGRAGGPGFLDDSAFLIRGLLDLHAADHDTKWLEAAAALTRDAARFADADGGWFFAVDTPDLIVRPRGLDDTALPSGSAVMVENLARLSYLSGDVGALSTASRTLDRGAQVMRSDPTSHPYLILARQSVLQARRAGASGAAAAPSLVNRQPLTPEPAKAASAAAATAPASVDPPAGASPAAPPAAGIKGQVVGRGNRERVVEAEWSFPAEATRPGGAAVASITVNIKDGWHVNSSRPTLDYLIPTKVTIPDPGGTTVEAIDYPPGQMVKLQFADQELSVYQGTVTIKPRLRVPRTAQPSSIPITARLTYQSCSDKSCLPPETVEFKAPLVVAGAALNEQEMAADTTAKASMAPLAGERQGTDRLSTLWREGRFLLVFGLIFLGGLSLCLTPCVYPMIPVTLGYFSQQSPGGGIGRRVGLPALYVLGIAITYSILGVIAGLTGGLFGSAMQSRWIVGALILLFIAMAFWLFGAYELRLPGFLTRLGTGRAGALGAFLMGLTLGLVAAPCIGPFVLSLLVFVGASGSPILGFWMFFVLALGMGLPFLVLGTFSGMLAGLPRSGAWLIYAKKVMGIALLAVAIYFIQPFVSDRILGWSAILFAAGAGLYLAWIERTRMKAAWFVPLRVVVGVMTVALGLWLALPLVRAREEVPWQAYSDQALDAARAAGKPVLIDFFAVWCAPCRELDRHTYSDPRVASRLDRFTLLKADLTNEESTQVQALRERFDIYGVPTVVFVAADGTDRKDLRLTGFEPPDAFLKRLEQVR
jgi:uncharacterized protein YyaL (SSP411 family)